MFASQKSTGAGAMTIAYLLVAFLFSPALLIVWRPLGYTSVSLAIACTAFCTVMAWGEVEEAKGLIQTLDGRPRTAAK